MATLRLPFRFPSFSLGGKAWSRLSRVRPEAVIASPFLYMMVVPLALLDLCLMVYQYVVFPLLGISIVARPLYIRADRYRLPYLSPVQKLACAYCGYANGLLHYAVRIAGETERYFCPIRHQQSPGFHAPPHHRAFVEYGDETAWRRRRSRYRKS